MATPERRVNRRVFMAGAAQVAGGAAALAACSSNGSPKSSATTSSSSAGSSSPTATSSAKALSGQIVISTLASQFAPSQQQALTAAYNKQRPNVKLVWELQNLPADQYTTWLGTQLSSGNVRPDLVSGVYEKDYAHWVNYAQYRYTKNPFTGKPWNDALQWDKAQTYNSRGQLIGVPTQTYSIEWFYNKDLFARAAVSPPKDWNAFVDVCAKLKAKGITPIVANFDYQVPQWIAEIYIDPYLVEWAKVVRAQPGDWDYNPSLDGKFKYDPKNPNFDLTYTFNAQRYYQGIRDGKLRFDTPAVADWVANLAKIFPRYANSDLFVINDPYPVFLQQNAAMMINQTGDLIQLKNDLASLSPDRLKALGIKSSNVKPFKWGTFTNPPMTGPLVKGPIRSIEGAGASPSIVDKNQQQTELSLDFLMFYCSPVGYQTFIDSAADTYIPAGPPLINDTHFKASFQQAFKSIKFLGQSQTTYNIVFMLWGSPNVQNQAKDLFRKALQGSISPTSFASQLQKLVKDNFADIIKTAGLKPEDIDNPAKQPGT